MKLGASAVRDASHLTEWQAQFLATYGAALAVDGTIYDTIGIWPLVVAGLIWLGMRVKNFLQRKGTHHVKG